MELLALRADANTKHTVCTLGWVLCAPQTYCIPNDTRGTRVRSKAMDLHRHIIDQYVFDMFFRIGIQQAGFEDIWNTNVTCEGGGATSSQSQAGKPATFKRWSGLPRGATKGRVWTACLHLPVFICCSRICQFCLSETRPSSSLRNGKFKDSGGYYPPPSGGRDLEPVVYRTATRAPYMDDWWITRHPLIALTQTREVQGPKQYTAPGELRTEGRVVIQSCRALISLLFLVPIWVFLSSRPPTGSLHTDCGVFFACSKDPLPFEHIKIPPQLSFLRTLQLLFACPPCVLVGALCVPCAEVLLLGASGGLITAPQFSRCFSLLDLTLPDRNPPPPL